MSGDRTLELDLNQMAVADFDIDARVDAQTVVSQMSVWGLGAGNRFGFVAPELLLNTLNNPGDRNGFVNLPGNAAFSGARKSAGEEKSGSARVELGGRRLIKKKQTTCRMTQNISPQ